MGAECLTPRFPGTAGAWRWMGFRIPSEKAQSPLSLSLPAFFVVFGQVLILGNHLQPIKRSNVWRWWIKAFKNVFQFIAHFPIESCDPEVAGLCLFQIARGRSQGGALTLDSTAVHPEETHAECPRWCWSSLVEMEEGSRPSFPE